jgi:hypothetical protein
MKQDGSNLLWQLFYMNDAVISWAKKRKKGKGEGVT